MKRVLLVAICALVLASHAESSEPAPMLAGLDFLVGEWSEGRGVVGDSGGTASGSSVITREAGGAVLLRRDHTSLTDSAGKPSGDFNQIMMIYPEGKTLHADYSDGTHVIHYASAEIEPGHSVVFTSAPQPNIPTFRLSYTLSNPTTLAVSFAMAPPGGTDFHPIATGALTRRQ